MKNRKTNLDEMQEQKLLKIEHNGCWLAFWGLLAAIVVQTVLSFDLKLMAGEYAVFMALCVYVAVACKRAGIWDRRLQPNLRTNLIASVIAGAAVFGITFASVSRRFPEARKGALIAAAIGCVVAFVGCFAALSISVRAYKKRVEELENESGDE